MHNDTKPYRVAIPYTVPVGFPYAKGSGPWLETLANALIENSKVGGDRPLDVYIMGPSYERWSNIKYPWRVLPISYMPPAYFPEGHKWHNDFPRDSSTWNAVPDDSIDIRAPIHTFTSNVAYALTKEVEANAFRAITETTRWRMDFIPSLFGFSEFDGVFPQHVSWNLIASAHYARRGKALSICHETCMRGGWLSEKMRTHIRHAFVEQGGTTTIIAISDPVAKLLHESESGPQFDEARIKVMENPMNDSTFYPIPGGVTKKQMIEEDRRLQGTPTEGRWVTFVGRTAEFKGLEQLLRSWAVYLNTTEDAKSDILLMMGKFIDPDSPFAEYAKELGIADNVRFLGFSRPPFINRMHNASNLFAMTSLGEGDGVVVKEAAAAGLRVLVPDSGGPGKTVTDIMGRKFISRDPDPKTNQAEATLVQLVGLQLLRGKRRIKWGELTLEGPDIVRQYVKWRTFYDQGITNPQERAQLDKINKTLLNIADNWISEEVSSIRQGAEALLKGRRFVFTDWRQNSQLLAEVFRTYGGMALETQSFAEQAAEELAEPVEKRRQLGKMSSNYTHSKYSAGAYAERLYENYLRPSFERKLDPQSRYPFGDWEDTTLAEFQIDASVAHAFKVWEQARTYGELVDAVMNFDRAVVSILGNPDTYANKWPAAYKNAMDRPGRTSHLVARLAGIDSLHFEWQREVLRRETERHPCLQSVFYQRYHGKQLKPQVQLALDQTRIGTPYTLANMTPLTGLAASGMLAMQPVPVM